MLPGKEKNMEKINYIGKIIVGEKTFRLCI